MKALGARNKEAFNIDNGTVWSSGKVGDIFEDKFFYVPEHFGWLGPQYKGVKSLVSGIGWKITSIEGERFTRDLKGISFKEKRLSEVNGKVQGAKSSSSTRLEIEQVAYYDGEDKTRYELGRGTCAIEKNYGNRKVYLFVGFAEVEKGGQRPKKGHDWNFLNDRFFSEEGKCEKLKNTSGGRHRLVNEQIGRKSTKDTNKRGQVIVLGVGKESGKGILDFGRTQNNNHLIGVLMGVAINLSWVKDCDKHFSDASKSDSKEVTEEIIKCIENERKKIERTIGRSELKIKRYKENQTEVNVKAELIETSKEVNELKIGNAGKRPFKGSKTSRELKYKYE